MPQQRLAQRCGLRPALVLAILTLAGCGADAPPVRPGGEPAISITGDAAIGVATKIN